MSKRKSRNSQIASGNLAAGFEGSALSSIPISRSSVPSSRWYRVQRPVGHKSHGFLVWCYVKEGLLTATERRARGMEVLSKRRKVQPQPQPQPQPQSQPQPEALPQPAPVPQLQQPKPEPQQNQDMLRSERQNVAEGTGNPADAPRVNTNALQEEQKGQEGQEGQEGQKDSQPKPPTLPPPAPPPPHSLQKKDADANGTEIGGEGEVGQASALAS